MPKYTKLLNPDEDPVDMRAVAPPDGNGKAFAVRQARQVGTGRAPRPPGAERRQVRVKVKTHDKGAGAYRSSVSATLNYVSKEGRTFDKERDMTERDRDALSDEWKSDRLIHHWMINPEDGDRLTLDQVKTLTRDTMEAVERGIPKPERDDFRWMAGAEQRDGVWHVHVAVRGVANDRDLRFHPIFERHWVREYAEEATTDQLGWRGARALADERTHRDRNEGRDPTDERDDRERSKDRSREMSRDMVEEHGQEDTRRRRHGRDMMEDLER